MPRKILDCFLGVDRLVGLDLGQKSTNIVVINQNSWCKCAPRKFDRKFLDGEGGSWMVCFGGHGGLETEVCLLFFLVSFFLFLCPSKPKFLWVVPVYHLLRERRMMGVCVCRLVT